VVSSLNIDIFLNSSLNKKTFKKWEKRLTGIQPRIFSPRQYNKRMFPE